MSQSSQAPQQIQIQYPNMKVKKYHLINYLIHKHNLKSYLEVGTRRVEDNYDKIHLPSEQKESIEPTPQTGQPTYQTTSDEAFQQIIQQGKKYDIIFIDGLHLQEQAEKDIQNALKCLTISLPDDPSFIILHDCNPIHEILQRPQYEVNGTYPPWNGTVWKAIVKFNHDANHPYIARVIDTDWGCGIITPVPQSQYLPKPPLQPEYLTYSYLEKNRQKLLHLTSTTEFRRLY